VSGGEAPYKGFIIDTVEYPDWWALRLYRDNIEGYSEYQKVALFEYVKGLLQLAKDAGIQIYLEVYEDAGRVWR
jgi:hypothetical protein